MANRNEEIVCRIRETLYSNGEICSYKIEKLIPEKIRFFIFVIQREEWYLVAETRTIEKASEYARRTIKYGNPFVVYQSDRDELDLARALE